MRLIRAPPDSSAVSIWSPEPSMHFSKSTENCCTILQGQTDTGIINIFQPVSVYSIYLSTVSTHWSRALVLRDGSSGLKFLYSSTSFSMERSWLCSLARRFGRVSRMWLVSCCAGQRSELDHREHGRCRNHPALTCSSYGPISRVGKSFCNDMKFHS